MFPLKVGGGKIKKKAEEVCGEEARSLRRAKKVLEPAGGIFTARLVSISFTLHLLLICWDFYLFESNCFHLSCLWLVHSCPPNPGLIPAKLSLMLINRRNRISFPHQISLHHGYLDVGLCDSRWKTCFWLFALVSRPIKSWCYGCRCFSFLICFPPFFVFLHQHRPTCCSPRWPSWQWVALAFLLPTCRYLELMYFISLKKSEKKSLKVVHSNSHVL